MVKTEKNNFYAIVPMKAHSERVRDKNIRVFNGKPLFYWIFNCLTRVNCVSKIILDTDSEIIAEMVASHFAVDVSLRPNNLRGDLVSVNRLIEHVVGLYPGQDYFLQTHATNPLLRPETINRAITQFSQSENRDSLFSVTEYFSRFYQADKNPVNHDPAELIRTQDLNPVYEENSNLYIFSKDSFKKTDSRIGQKPIFFVVDKFEAVDIDEEEDFLIAEILMEKFKRIKE